MAQRRMFSKEITSSDNFVDMPASSQLLYFHLGMEADDEGFLGNAKMLGRAYGSNNDDLKLLQAKGFVIIFESGVSVIKDWGINNKIRKDRLKATIYEKEKKLLKVDEHGAYEIRSTRCQPDVGIECQPDVGIGKDRLGKVSLGQESILQEKTNPVHLQEIKESEVEDVKDKIDYKSIVDYLNEKAGTNYKPNSKATKKVIKARIAEGFEVDDFKKVIDNKFASWKGTRFENYMRPTTLFTDKFESYLNEKQVKQKQEERPAWFTTMTAEDEERVANNPEYQI